MRTSQEQYNRGLKSQCAAGGQNEPYSSVDCVQSIVHQSEF
eukprot:COSAG02_NODE_39144_length_420_cov_1.280374_2_plen_40_part_01